MAISSYQVSCFFHFILYLCTNYSVFRTEALLESSSISITPPKRTTRGGAALPPLSTQMTLRQCRKAEIAAHHDDESESGNESESGDESESDEEDESETSSNSNSNSNSSNGSNGNDSENNEDVGENENDGKNDGEDGEDVGENSNGSKNNEHVGENSDNV